MSIKQGGADRGVNYSKEGWQKEVLKITGGKGVDVIYDPVGLIRGTHAHSRTLANPAFSVVSRLLTNKTPWAAQTR